jgi:ribA/ribD-fused uncharacterized protein
MKKAITFTKTKLPFGWLGNMSAFPIEHEGKTWRTAEALFQALRFDDEEIREEIRSQKSPMAAKFVAKRNVDKMIVEQLSEQDIHNMTIVVGLKAEQHPELKDMLLDTGNLPIIEDCTRRGKRGSGLFWGAILKHDGVWEGKNTLGVIWMALRSSLREPIATYGVLNEEG